MTVPGFHTSLAVIRAENRVPDRPPLVVAGRYDRAAIMREAVRLAQFDFRTCGPWRRRMSMALKCAWEEAKAAKAEPVQVDRLATWSAPVWTPASRIPAPAFLSRARWRSWNDYAR